MTNKKFALLFALLALVLLVPAPVQAQVTTTSTTLSAAITSTQTVFNVASATGIVAPAFAQPNVPTGNDVLLVVDREAMYVTGVSGTTVTVIRGYSETNAGAHNSAATVWVGPPSYFDQMPLDPVGACTASNYPNMPRVNTKTGSIMNCVGGLWDVSDGMFFVPPQACFEAASANAGSGDGTIIIDGSVPALKGIISSTGNVVFTCAFTVPGQRINPSKGVVIKDITYLYSPQTLAPTSMVASTFKYFQPPAAGTSETASSATLVDACNTCTQTPVVGSANLTAVSAGQYYSEKVTLGTPLVASNDLRTYVFTFQLNQTAASAMTVTSPGLWVHYAVAP